MKNSNQLTQSGEGLSRPNRLGRAQTTGKFESRSELEERIVFLVTERNMTLASAANCCKISRPTAIQIFRKHNPDI